MCAEVRNLDYWECKNSSSYQLETVNATEFNQEFSNYHHNMPNSHDACCPPGLCDEHMNRNYFPLSVYSYFNLESPEGQRDDLGPDPQRPNKQQPRAQKHILNYLFNLEHRSVLWKDHTLSYCHTVLSWRTWYPLTPPHPRHHCLHSCGLLLHLPLLLYYYFVRCQQTLSPAFHMYCVTEYIEMFHCLKKILRFGWKKRLAVVPWWDLCEGSSETNSSTLGDVWGVKESWVFTWQLFIHFMRFLFCWTCWRAIANHCIHSCTQ